MDFPKQINSNCKDSFKSERKEVADIKVMMT